jgi:hypothetical protein
MDKFEAAHIVRQFILSFDTVTDKNDTDFTELYVHESGKPGSLIHFTPDREYNHRHLCFYEYYENNHYFTVPTGSVENLFERNYKFNNSLHLSKYNYSDRNITKLNFIQEYCHNMENITFAKTEMMRSERLDQFVITVHNDTGKLIVSHTSVFFSYIYPSIYVTFVFDEQLNLINLGIKDNHLKSIMDNMTIDFKLKTFEFFIDYFVKKEFRELIDVEYTEIDQSNIASYLSIHAMYDFK